MALGKQIAREIFQQTLSSIDIAGVMERKLQFEGKRLVLANGSTIDFSNASRIQIVAIGKAAHAMVTGLVALLPRGTACTGVIAAPTTPAQAIPGMEYFVAGHPTPNSESWRAAEVILRLLRLCDECTLVFFLLSGGGSALVELP